MALTDNPEGKLQTRLKPKKKGGDEGNTRYSDKQKLEAVSMWMAIGNIQTVHRLLNIPRPTLDYWKAQQWWATTVEELKTTEKLQLSARMKKIIEASQLVVAQRLETGDPVMNHKGEIVYKPINIRDAHRVAIDTINTKAAIEKSFHGEDQSAVRDDEKLEKLAEKFAEMATKSIEKKINKSRTVDAEEVKDKNAVYEEREARLQARISGISLSSGTNQESDSEDDSETAE